MLIQRPQKFGDELLIEISFIESDNNQIIESKTCCFKIDSPLISLASIAITIDINMKIKNPTDSNVVVRQTFQIRNFWSSAGVVG